MKKTHRIKRNVFVVGNVSAGKSSLINALLAVVSRKKKWAYQNHRLHGPV